MMRRIKSCPDMVGLSLSPPLMPPLPPPPSPSLSLSPSPSPGILSRRTSQTGISSAPPPRSVSTGALSLPMLPVSMPYVATDIVNDVIFELSIPAPAIVTGQCHMMYGFPEEIMQRDSHPSHYQTHESKDSGEDEYVKDFAICAVTPTESPETDEHARHIRMTASGRTCYAERFSELRDQEQAARYYEFLRRIRRRSRTSNIQE